MPTARDSNDLSHLFCIPGVVGDRDIGIKSYLLCVLLDCVSLSDSLFLRPKYGLFWQYRGLLHARDYNLAPHLFCIPGVVGDRDIGFKSY